MKRRHQLNGSTRIQKRVFHVDGNVRKFLGVIILHVLRISADVGRNGAGCAELSMRISEKLGILHTERVVHITRDVGEALVVELRIYISNSRDAVYAWQSSIHLIMLPLFLCFYWRH
jgi:hypothetical protein